MKKYVFAISGASGSAIGLRVLDELAKTAQVHLVMSEGAKQIMRDETSVDWTAEDETQMQEQVRNHLMNDNVHCWSNSNMRAPISSGSFRTDGMFVVPCSMKTLSGISNGYAGTLIERAADVTMKEGRPLLLSPREMPLGPIHLQNMLKLSKLGVKIAPPIPGFYHHPASMEDLVDFMAGKILDAMGIQHEIYPRWRGSKENGTPH